MYLSTYDLEKSKMKVFGDRELQGGVYYLGFCWSTLLLNLTTKTLKEVKKVQKSKTNDPGQKDPKFRKIEIGRGRKFPKIRKIKLEPGRNFQKTEK